MLFAEVSRFDIGADKEMVCDIESGKQVKRSRQLAVEKLESDSRQVCGKA